MEEQNKNRRPGNPNAALAIRVAAIGYALYMLYQLVRRYLAGGADAPSLTVVLVGAVLLGGGAAALGILSWKLWRRETAKKDDEED
jgi:hypothetical protein